MLLFTIIEKGLHLLLWTWNISRRHFGERFTFDCYRNRLSSYTTNSVIFNEWWRQKLLYWMRFWCQPFWFCSVFLLLHIRCDMHSVCSSHEIRNVVFEYKEICKVFDPESVESDLGARCSVVEFCGQKTKTFSSSRLIFELNKAVLCRFLVDILVMTWPRLNEMLFLYFFKK